MTVAFPHCCAPTVGQSYIYRRRGFILTLFGDTQTLTSHFGSPPSNRKLQVRRVSANRNVATEWKESRINAERWAVLRFGWRTNQYNSAHNTPTQQLNNAASWPSSSVCDCPDLHMPCAGFSFCKNHIETDELFASFFFKLFWCILSIKTLFSQLSDSFCNFCDLFVFGAGVQ